ncbi:hypothetical protein LINPERHAP1_LOCUS21498 [Linum perenne]
MFDTLVAAKWWDWFGKDTPIIQKLAIRILSQTAASSGCERNWSVFERIHTKRNNMLDHKRLSDLVFVHYNMRLKHRYVNSFIEQEYCMYPNNYRRTNYICAFMFE